MSHLPNSCNRRSQSGLTLIELMIAMIVGLFLSVGVIQIFTANNLTYRMTENISRLQENGRFALENLGKAVRSAGFKGDTENSPTTNFPAVTYTASDPVVAFAANQLVSGTDGGIGGAGTLDPADDLFIRFRGSTAGSMADCTGTNIGQGTPFAGVEVVNRYFINNDSLTCHSSANAAGPQALIDNVVSMQILYGMTTDSAAYHDVRASCYLPASTTIGAGTDCTTLNFSQVVSIRIKLLLSTQGDNLTVDSTTQSLTFDDDGLADTMTDERLYRALTKTISLRNKIL